MAHKIDNESCSACGACAENCPEQAISYFAPKATYSVSAEKCIDCGLCATNCGSGAIRPE